MVGVHSATILRWIDTRKVPVKKKKKTARGHYVFTEIDLRELQQYNERIEEVE